MPGWTFWLPVVGAWTITFAGGMMSAILQAQSTHTRLTRLSWLYAALAGLVAAVERGRAVWPAA